MKWIITAAFLFQLSAVMACDVCSMYMSITPNDYKHQFGFVYRTRMLKGSYVSLAKNAGTPKHLGHLTVIDQSQIKELFNTVELQGRIFLTERWNLDLSAPMQNNYRSADAVTQYDVYGIGDPSVLLSRQLFSTRSDGDQDKVVVRLELGLGAKVPLGKTSMRYDDRTPDLDMQPGTGSWDALGFLRFRARKGQWITGLIATARKNGMNTALEYRYGSGTTLTWDVMRAFQPGKWFVAPLTGLYGEYTGHDSEYGHQVFATGGNILFAQAGFRLMRGPWAAHFTWQQPMLQNWNGAQLSNNYRLMTGLNYNIVKAN